MAKAKYEAFEGVVCERLRKLRDKGARYRGQRDKAFKARDAADAALNETSSSEEKKRANLLSDYGEAVRRIKDLDHKLRDIDKSIDQTIEYADQAELFPDPDTFNAPDEEDGEGEEESDKQMALPRGSVGTRNGEHTPAEAGA